MDLNKKKIKKNKKDILDLEKNKKEFKRIIKRIVLILIIEKLE